MNKFLTAILHPHDGTREKVKSEVVLSRQSVERAANRFEETIRDLLNQNDQLTGRHTDHANQIPPTK